MLKDIKNEYMQIYTIHPQIQFTYHKFNNNNLIKDLLL